MNSSLSTQPTTHIRESRYYFDMVRMIIYGLVAFPIGVIAAILVNNEITLATVLGAGFVSSFVAICVAAYMDVSGILDRPFWNRQDVEWITNHRTPLFWDSLEYRFDGWMRSKIQD
jgi:hypothetical protein